MNDRLKEFKNIDNSNSQPLKASQVDIESQLSSTSQDQPLVSKEFKDDVSAARNLIEKIKANTEEIASLKSEYSQATMTAKEKQISEQIDMNLKDNKKHTQKLKGIMDKLKDDIEQTKQDRDKQGDAFVKQNLYNSISSGAKQALLDSQRAQEEYRQGLKSKTTRQIKHVAPEMTDDQIEKIAEDPEMADQIFKQKMFNTASTQLKNAVSDVQEKYKAILQLEQSIQELHQLMLDIATMVQVQGEIIDNIEVNVNVAQKNVEKANQNLTTAKKHHISAKKKQCILLVIVIVIVAIILGVTIK